MTEGACISRLKPGVRILGFRDRLGAGRTNHKVKMIVLRVAIPLNSQKRKSSSCCRVNAMPMKPPDHHQRAPANSTPSSTLLRHPWGAAGWTISTAGTGALSGSMHQRRSHQKLEHRTARQCTSL